MDLDTRQRSAQDFIVWYTTFRKEAAISDTPRQPAAGRGGGLLQKDKYNGTFA